MLDSALIMGMKATLSFLTALMLSASPPLHSQIQEQTAPDVYKSGQGVSPPRLINHVEPQFSGEAQAAHYQGLCTLDLIVEKDGTPSHIRVTGPLGMGLDEKAIEAVQQWRFQPGMKNGELVRVEVAVIVDFRLGGPNNEHIAELLKKAASGDARSQLDLAHVYLNGEGVRKNENLGESYLKKAANQGLPKAQFELGVLSARRDTPDYPQAYMWLILAQRAGEKHCEKKLRDLTAKMTAEQLQSGQSLVSNWTSATQK
jgi:TonB family protein